MKKIAIVTRNMFGGGAERVIAQLINYLDGINVECILITIDEGEVFFKIPKNVKLFEIGKKSSNKLVDRVLRYKKVREIIVKHEIDIVLSLPEDIGIYVIAALLGSRIPTIVSERNNPWVMPDKKITRILRRITYPFAKGIIFQTNMAMSFFSRNIQNKGIVLKNPIDIDRIPAPYNKQREKIVVAAGRLDKQKNFKLLIESFAEFQKLYPEYKLVIYGEGKERNELECLANKLLKKHSYSFPGRQSDLLEKIKSASMFVLSSNYEGMPNVLLEAMCMGLPVISTDCPSGGPREVIENNVNGILIPVNDHEALINSMIRLTDNNFAKMLGENAYLLKDKLTDTRIFEAWRDYLIK